MDRIRSVVVVVVVVVVLMLHTEWMTTYAHNNSVRAS